MPIVHNFKSWNAFTTAYILNLTRYRVVLLRKTSKKADYKQQTKQLRKKVKNKYGEKINEQNNNVWEKRKNKYEKVRVKQLWKKVLQWMWGKRHNNKHRSSHSHNSSRRNKKLTRHSVQDT